MNVILLLCLGLPTLGYAYEMVIHHRQPWWKSQDLSTNEVQRSYRYFYPQAQKKMNQHWDKELKKDRWNYPSVNSIRKKYNNRWNSPASMFERKKPAYPWSANKNYPMVKSNVPTIPPMSAERMRAMNAANWPDSIPPLIMIKLPLDEPPAALD